jgi:hypothetical protein
MGGKAFPTTPTCLILFVSEERFFREGAGDLIASNHQHPL